METEIEKLLTLIDQVVAARSSTRTTADAISRELDRTPETTATVSLRNSQVVKEFQQAAADAHIRADAVRATLLIVHDVLSRALLAV